MQFTLSRKLYGIVGLTLILLVMVAALSFVMQRKIINGYEQQMKENGVQVEVALKSEVLVGSVIKSFKNFLFSRKETYIQALKQDLDSIRSHLKTYEDLSDSQDEKGAVQDAKALVDTYGQAVNNLVEAGKTNHDILAVDELFSPLDQTLAKMREIATKNYTQGKEQIRSAAARTMYVQFAIAGVAIILGLVLSTIVIRGILSSISMIQTTVEKASRGDLSQNLAVTAQDELGHMAESFNGMIKNLRQIVNQINTSATTLASSSRDLSSTSEGMSRSAQSQASQTDQVVTAITEVSQTIMDMAKNASMAAEASKSASSTAAKGKQIVDTTADDMSRIANTVQEAARTIEELGRSSAQIGEIVNVINGIADQTNLLALNAAIEAARAGEQGRGFAVVADEVRKLAERTGQATKDIAQRISGIQQAANESVDAMKKGSDEVGNGVGRAREASVSLDSIVTASSNAMDMVQRIAAATEQQSAATEEVTKNMEGISDITKQSTASTEQIKASASELSRLASELKETTAWFKA